MFKYACLNNISEKGLSRFSDQYQLTENVQEANGILVRSASMHGMDFSDETLAIARAGAGVNNIPIDECAKKGIVVFNTPGANANGVKELVFAGMLLASRDIVEGVDWVRANWNNEDIAKIAEKEKKRFAGSELQGKKLGIIGLGAIGVQVANTAVNLGMQVYGYDPYVSVDSAWHLSSRIHHVIRIEDIYDVCDYITIHVPALPSTKGMIDEHAIAMMKTGVILINMARDVLVDEEAVVLALRAGKIRRYVSDFPNSTVAGAGASRSLIWALPQKRPKTTAQSWQLSSSLIIWRTAISKTVSTIPTATWANARQETASVSSMKIRPT